MACEHDDGGADLLDVDGAAGLQPCFVVHQAIADEELLGQLKTNIGELISKLPHKLRDGCEDEVLGAAVDGDYAALVGQVTPYLNARLTAEDE